MSNKKVIDLKTALPNLPVLVEGRSSLADAYAASCMADAVAEKVKGTVSGVFGVLRHKMVQLYTTALAANGGNPAILKLDEISGDFLLACKEAEDSYADTGLPADRSKSSWVNAKSQLKSALENGYNFADNREVGQSALQKWSRDLRKAAEEAKEAAAVAEAEKRKTTDNAANDPAGDKQPVHSEKTTHSIFDGIPGADKLDTEDVSEEVLAAIVEAMQKVLEVSKTISGEKAIRILSGTQTQCDQALTSALQKLARAS